MAAPPPKYDVSQSDRLKSKAQAAPFVPLGIAGTLAALGWGVYTFKNRGNMSPSVFFMHLRVKAQGMIVGAITVGVGITLYQDYFAKREIKND